MSEDLLAHPAAQAMAQALVHFLWQGTVAGLIAAGALHLLAKSRASVRYAVATGALLVMAALPWITAFQIAASPSEPSFAAPAATALVNRPAPASAPRVQTEEAPRTFGASLLPGVLGLWLAGVAALSVWHLGGWRRIHRWSREARPVEEAIEALARDLGRRLRIRRAVTLLESAAVAVPTVVGWLRPVILVPASTLAGLSPRQLEAILAHELAHVRRHDYGINLLQTAIETLLFYHPAVWWVSAQVRKERENCCDDLAVAVCGDRLGYARALVDLEGLRGVPRLALAASGGSLSDRVRRLVGAPAKPSRRPWAAGLLVLALLPAGAVLQIACAHRPVRETVREADGEYRGDWSAERNGDKVQLRVRLRKGSFSWSSYDEYPLSAFTRLRSGSDIPFELRRDAGTFKLRGRFDGRKGKGTVIFTANPAYAKVMGYRPNDKRLLEMAIYDLGLDYIQEMRKLGYGVPDEVVRLRRANVLRDTVRDLVHIGHQDRSVESLLQLNLHNITPDYIRGMKEAGYPRLHTWQLVELSTNAVDPAYAKRMSQSGYGPLSVPDLIRFHINGIDPGWLLGIVQAGYSKITPEELLSFHNNGVDPKWLLGIVQAGYGKASPEEILSMHNNGVKSQWLLEMVQAGYGKAMPEEVISMYVNGVDAAFVRQARARGHDNLTPEEITDLHARGLS